jgi:nicotinate-nucleotide adenylyltransferase
MPTATRPPITPLALPKGVRTLLVFGGSFDPPHFGHEIASLTSLAGFDPATTRILLVPAARSPHKADGPRASDRQRLAMVRLVARGYKHVLVWTDELDRAAAGKPSYSIETLRRLRRVIPPGVKLRLLIGTDQAVAFHRWKSPRAIIKVAEPLVLRRRPIVTARALGKAMDHMFWTRAELASWEARLAENILSPESSTAARAAIPGAPLDVRRWKRIAGLNGIPAEVAQYIVKRNLYGFRPKKNPAGRRGAKGG